MKTFATLLSLLPALTAILLLVRNRSPFGWITWIPKLMGGAVSAWMALVALAAAVLGLYAQAPAAAVLGGLSFVLCGVYVLRVSSPRAEFDRAFGPGWTRRIPPAMQPRLQPNRWSLAAPQTRQEPRLERDIPFWTVPAGYTSTGQPRPLLCDVWQPPEGIPTSGLAFIYSHGSAWTMMDKDLGTRPFFRHLASQGHVVMDVAYRLFPETDMDGMAGDVQRAIAWMKDHAAAYGVQPDRIVVGGGSAGGHLSLLVAYAWAYATAHAQASEPFEALLPPEDVGGRDLSVCGVVSEYGPPDLTALYYHTNQHKTTRALPPGPPPPKPASSRPNALQRLMGSSYTRLHLESGASSGAFIYIIGVHPDEHPEAYARLSPVSYAHAGCPPTLQIQGDYDLVTPPSAARTLHARLQELCVPSLLVIYPQTDHGFDLALPAVSPTAQSALYEIDRFLAVLAGG
jgi:acetyl esterase/lipase